jgi:hypothetical protein
MGQCAEKRLLTAPKRSACPCPKTYPFLAATLPTVRDQQLIGVLEDSDSCPPVPASLFGGSAPRLSQRTLAEHLQDVLVQAKELAIQRASALTELDGQCTAEQPELRAAAIIHLVATRPGVGLRRGSLCSVTRDPVPSEECPPLPVTPDAVTGPLSAPLADHLNLSN